MSDQPRARDLLDAIAWDDGGFYDPDGFYHPFVPEDDRR